MNYILYQNGSIVGSTDIILIQGVKVATKFQSFIEALIAAAHKDGVELKLNSAFRPYEEQLAIRKQNVIDKSKVNDDAYLKSADSGLFSPRTAKPGYSNHQNGRAFDINATPKEYAWLKVNALKYGFVRTVKEEAWHWEYLPTNKQYDFVPADHPTWK